MLSEADGNFHDREELQAEAQWSRTRPVSYRVFARKYRPQTFQDVVGQEHITKTLQNAIQQDRVAQAYLFVGPRGIGKTSTARILAKALNCEQGPTPEPCGKCSSCLEIAEGNNLDVIEIDGASNNGVDHIRSLRENAQYTPAKSRYKIYLIDEVHMLSTGAFNALLKTLEEPPEHVKFIFATTEAQKVPATITSRCQRFDLRRISDEAIAKHLLFIASQEAVDLAETAAYAIAKGADGGLRDAESMLDQAISFCGNTIHAADILEVFGFTSEEIIADLAQKLLTCDVQGALEIAAEQEEAGKDPTRLVEHLISFLRDLLIAQATGLGTAEMLAAASLVPREKLLELLEHFATTENRLRWSMDKKMQVDVALIKAVHLIELASLSDVVETIASLRDGQAPPELSRMAQPESSRMAQPTQSAHPARASHSPPASPVKIPPRSVPDPKTDPKPVLDSLQEKEQDDGRTDSPQQAEDTLQAVPTPPSDAMTVAEVWGDVVETLAKTSPFKFGWLETGTFQVENNGRIVVEFPESQQACAEAIIWSGPQKTLDEELSLRLGRTVKFHPEFLATTNAPAASDRVEEISFERRTENLESREDSAPASPSPDAAKSASDGLEAFKNDPLIQKALEIFRAEIVTTQNP